MAVAQSLRDWLMNQSFPHMLQWTDQGNREFSVIHIMNRRHRVYELAVAQRLREWLTNQSFPHMLEWTDQENSEFSIFYMHRRHRDFDIRYLDLFKALDQRDPRRAAIYARSPNYDRDCKARFRAILQKLLRDGILQLLRIEAIGPSCQKYHYKFLVPAYLVGG